MKIQDIIGEGVFGDIAHGIKQSFTPQVFKNMPSMPDRGSKSQSDYEHCIQAAAQYGYSPDECGRMRGAPTPPAQQQQPAAPAQPPASSRVHQVEIGGTTLTRSPGGDWYEMTTNTLITDPAIVARADKRWQIQQQNIQMSATSHRAASRSK